LNVAHPCPLQALEDWPKPRAVGIIGIELAGILHGGSEGERLAAGPGTEIEDLPLRSRPRETRREL
jgi:hypothetical protein